MSVHGHRLERLAEQIRDEVGELVAGELKDPRIGLATVTHVELSGDMRHARVLVGVAGGEEAQAETLKGLASAACFVRRELGRRLRIRRVPEVIFASDPGWEGRERVEALLGKIKNPGESDL